MDWRNCMSESAKKMSNILINKVFTIPYIDKMINDSENKDIFLIVSENIQKAERRLLMEMPSVSYIVIWIPLIEMNISIKMQS